MVFTIPRRKTSQVMVGGIGIGSDYPIRVQSMTNTNTEDVTETVSQIIELADAGSELVRVTVNTEKAAKAVPHIVERLKNAGYEVGEKALRDIIREAESKKPSRRSSSKTAPKKTDSGRKDGIDMNNN
mgnify:CR=1 FL=1